MKIAVLDDYQSVSLQMADWSRVRDIAEIDVFADPVSAQSAPRILAGYDVVCLMRERMPFGRELIEQLPNLKLICITGPHNRTLDLQAASERGIAVCFTEFNAHSAHATPELAWGLILAAARHIPAEDQGMRHGRWQTTVGTTLHGKTLGLFGLGRIGRRMAEIGTAFGMPVIAWSQNLTDAAAASVGARRVDKSTLFRESDVLSIHVVLSERTHNAIGPDEPALIEALMEKRIAIAGLDVFCDEPLPADSPIRSIPNAVLTPHLGFVVDDGYRDFYAQTVENILAFADGHPVRLLAPPKRTAT
jgi:phosphoglycerate dehydrogenase-like enzyme